MSRCSKPRRPGLFLWMAAAIAPVLLSACVLCKDEVLTEVRSPSGKYVARAGKYGCLTNTGFYGLVEVEVVGPEPDVSTAKCGDPGTGVASVRFELEQHVELRWESDRVLIVRVQGMPERKVTQTSSCLNDETVAIRIEQ